METDLRSQYEKFIMYGPKSLRGGAADGKCNFLYDGVSTVGQHIESYNKIGQFKKNTFQSETKGVSPQDTDIHPEVILFIRSIASLFVKIKMTSAGGTPALPAFNAADKFKETVEIIRQNMFGAGLDSDGGTATKSESSASAGDGVPSPNIVFVLAAKVAKAGTGDNKATIKAESAGKKATFETLFGANIDLSSSTSAKAIDMSTRVTALDAEELKGLSPDVVSSMIQAYISYVVEGEDATKGDINDAINNAPKPLHGASNGDLIKGTYADRKKAALLEISEFMLRSCYGFVSDENADDKNLFKDVSATGSIAKEIISTKAVNYPKFKKAVDDFLKENKGYDAKNAITDNKGSTKKDATEAALFVYSNLLASAATRLKLFQYWLSFRDKVINMASSAKPNGAIFKDFVHKQLECGDKGKEYLSTAFNLKNSSNKILTGNDYKTFDDTCSIEYTTAKSSDPDKPDWLFHTGIRGKAFKFLEKETGKSITLWNFTDLSSTPPQAQKLVSDDDAFVDVASAAFTELLTQARAKITLKMNKKVNYKGGTFTYGAFTTNPVDNVKLLKIQAGDKQKAALKYLSVADTTVVAEMKREYEKIAAVVYYQPPVINPTVVVATSNDYKDFRENAKNFIEGLVKNTEYSYDGIKFKKNDVEYDDLNIYNDDDEMKKAFGNVTIDADFNDFLDKCNKSGKNPEECLKYLHDKTLPGTLVDPANIKGDANPILAYKLLQSLGFTQDDTTGKIEPIKQWEKNLDDDSKAEWIKIKGSAVEKKAFLDLLIKCIAIVENTPGLLLKKAPSSTVAPGKPEKISETDKQITFLPFRYVTKKSLGRNNIAKYLSAVKQTQIGKYTDYPAIDKILDLFLPKIMNKYMFMNSPRILRSMNGGVDGDVSDYAKALLDATSVGFVKTAEGLVKQLEKNKRALSPKSQKDVMDVAEAADKAKEELAKMLTKVHQVLLGVKQSPGSFEADKDLDVMYDVLRQDSLKHILEMKKAHVAANKTFVSIIKELTKDPDFVAGLKELSATITGTVNNYKPL